MRIRELGENIIDLSKLDLAMEKFIKYKKLTSNFMTVLQIYLSTTPTELNAFYEFCNNLDDHYISDMETKFDTLTSKIRDSTLQYTDLELYTNVKWESEMSFLFSNQNTMQQLLETKAKQIQNIATSALFQRHCVVKLADNNNEITLLSFGGNTNIRHTLVMKYVSVGKLNNYNKWVPFTDNHNNRIHIGRDEDYYIGMRAVIGGSNNHLLFITYYYNNISVFNLNTFQFIKHDRLPTDNWIWYHCFVSTSENGQEMTKTKQGKNENKNCRMILFCEKTGLSIDYDEDDNTFQFCKLPVCDDIAPFFRYAYVFVNDTILFFGGWNGKFGDKKIMSKAVHKYSLRKNKWKTFQNTLPSPLFDCAVILNEDNTHVHIIGGRNENKVFVSTHMNAIASEWLSEEEMKGSVQLRAEEEEVEMCFFLFCFEKYKKWMKWWNQRGQRDKAEVIEKFNTMSNVQFREWLLNECKWKNEITKNDISSIRFSIVGYLEFVTLCSLIDYTLYILMCAICNRLIKTTKKMKLINCVFFCSYERKKLIKMKQLTFEELLCQCHHCLEPKDFQKINKENLKLQIVDVKNNIIETDEVVMGEFKNKEPTFKITLIPSQQIVIGKTKTIKNALVVMIAISEYKDSKKWPNLENVKDRDTNNFKSIFKQELNYEFVCNEEPEMNKEDVNEFLADLISTHKLHKNKKEYDALIMIISGHGDEEDVLVTSEGNSIPINEIRSSFDCSRINSLKDCPKIFIIDVCRGNVVPQNAENIPIKGKNNKEQNNMHNDNGFLMIWSTTKGYQVADLSLFSESMKNIIISKYKIGYPLSQMLREIREDIKRKGSGEWYCVESQDTIDYDITFQQRKSV
ncbi:hypothetical protein RFI_35630 [Reticulomyxa filosa]|uniref:Caspase family p20 domain-containing protein n=1 Tax=Reticulomyxa filosa TaxID=46433 RepID=X6LJL9_RETFI|nr:hypothetical protein RFI_35630 [Reticulomyxa filosa]|eukprot:ETO01809.1 hypothetical protein RFI_35630 [Reticulomyxa filosa]